MQVRYGWMLSMGLVACGGAPADDPEALPRRLLVIGVDGVRGDAFGLADTPNLDALFLPDGLRLDAQIHQTGVAVSGPGWASILTGVEVDDHDVLSNDHLDQLDPAWPPFPVTVQEAGHDVAVVAHWDGVLHLVGRDRVALAEHNLTDQGVSDRGAELITAGAHDLVFLHLDDVDHAGHTSGFETSNPDYLAAIEEIDRLAGPLLDAVTADAAYDWVVLLTTDHGGKGDSHGVPNAENRTIVQAGWGVGVVLPQPSYHMDIAATALDLFGLPRDDLDAASWLTAP